MSTAMVPQPNRFDDPQFIEAIKQTVAKGATPAQLTMFLEVCRSTGLNPFLKEIWYVAEKGLIMAARDGYLRVANENPQFDGIETRVERDEKQVPIKAVCTVWRKDRKHPVICEAYFNEYNKTSPVWKQYPSAMISKVAEVLALKRSFAINGVVTEEEIGQGEGSRAAAQEVASAKIALLQKQIAPPAAIMEWADIEPAQEEPPATLQGIEQRHAAGLQEAAAILEDASSLPKAEAAKRAPAAKTTKAFDMLGAFATMKTEVIRETGTDALYYGVLNQFGYKKSNLILDKNVGRQVYKAMGTALARFKELRIMRSELAGLRKDIPAADFWDIAEGLDSNTIEEIGYEDLDALLTKLRARQGKP